MTSIGIYGGTFDPVHFGHLNMAVEMLERHRLDEIWWIPVMANPFKEKEQAASSDHRLAMLSLVAEDHDQFHVVDIETRRVGPSYTIDTLRELTAVYPNQHFSLILGDDAVEHFDRWKEPEEIAQLCDLLIGARGEGKTPIPTDLPDLVRSKMEKGFTPISRFEISATEIRKRLKNGQFCGHLVPGKVLDYIYKHELYS